MAARGACAPSLRPCRRGTCAWPWRLWPGPTRSRTLWARLFQHRFPGAGSLGGHAVGNLVLTGLCELLGNPVDALDATARLLGAAGRVLPASCAAVDIVADVSGLDPADPVRRTQVRGQHEVASTQGRVHSVRLLPDPPVACPQAVEAVRAADWVVLGPGSLFTSVLPHLLVPELAAAVLASDVRRLLVLNLAPQVGETTGFSPEAHLEALVGHVPGLAARRRPGRPGRGSRRPPSSLPPPPGSAPSCGWKRSQNRVSRATTRIGWRKPSLV